MTFALDGNPRNTEIQSLNPKFTQDNEWFSRLSQNDLVGREILPSDTHLSTGVFSGGKRVVKYYPNSSNPQDKKRFIVEDNEVILRIPTETGDRFIAVPKTTQTLYSIPLSNEPLTYTRTNKSEAYFEANGLEEYVQNTKFQAHLNSGRFSLLLEKHPLTGAETGVYSLQPLVAQVKQVAQKSPSLAQVQQVAQKNPSPTPALKIIITPPHKGA